MKRNTFLIILALAAAAFCLVTGCSGIGAQTADVTAPADTASAEPAVSVTEPAAEATAAVTEPAPEATAAVDDAAAYDAIIAQYADAAKNGYYQSLVGTDDFDAAFGEYVAMEYKTNARPASYAIVDIDGNGTSELVIAALDDGTPCLYDVFAAKDGQAIRLFDIDLGYRQALTLISDGTMKITWSNSAFESGCDFYRMNADGVSAGVTDSFAEAYGENAIATFTHNGETLSEADWNAAIAALEGAGEASFDWIDIA